MGLYLLNFFHSILLTVDQLGSGSVEWTLDKLLSAKDFQTEVSCVRIFLSSSPALAYYTKTCDCVFSSDINTFK